VSDGMEALVTRHPYLVTFTSSPAIVTVF